MLISGMVWFIMFCVQIRDGHNENSTLLGQYCGGRDQFPSPCITSQYNFLWLKFKTDGSISNRGFYANYSSINVGEFWVLATPPWYWTLLWGSRDLLLFTFVRPQAWFGTFLEKTQVWCRMDLFASTSLIREYFGRNKLCAWQRGWNKNCNENMFMGSTSLFRQFSGDTSFI